MQDKDTEAGQGIVSLVPCSEGDLVFDEVVSCDLPDGHEGPHQTVVVNEHMWEPYRTTWTIQWDYSPRSPDILP